MKPLSISQLRILLPFVLLLLSAPKELPAEEISVLLPYYRTTTLSGLTHPINEMTLTSEVSGTCQEIYADTGEMVPPSATLVQIDPTFIQLDLAANKIARQQAKRKLEQEQKTLARYTVLKKENSTAQVTFDEVTLNVDLDRLNLQKLQNDKVQLEEKLARHQLKAPYGWTVIERFIEPGEYVQAGTAIAHLGDFRTLLIRLAVTYEELQVLKNMDSIPLHLPEINETASGTIYQISPIFDPKSRKIPLEIEISTAKDQQSPVLRGGMRAELVFLGRQEANSFLAPATSLINRYESHWLVSPDGTELQVLLLGRIKDKNQIIVSGEQLTSDKKILTAPAKQRQ